MALNGGQLTQTTLTGPITVASGGFTTRDLLFPAVSANVSFSGDFTATDLQLLVSDGATLTFAAGQTYTVNNQLLLSGVSGNPVVLTGVGAWDLNANGYAAVRYVDVTGSDASGGRTIYAVDSTGHGITPNWNFGNGKVWSGTTTSWTTDGNWLPSGVPVSTNVILIDGSTNTIPRLTNATTIAGLVVVGVSGTATLTVDMPYAGSDVLTVSGDVDIGANGILMHTANGATAVQRLVMTVGSNLNVAAGGLTWTSAASARMPGPAELPATKAPPTGEWAETELPTMRQGRPTARW